MSIEVTKGGLLPLNLVLEDGAEDKFPQAHVFDQNDVEVPGSPFNLTHVALGYYTNYDYTITITNERLVAIYKVWEDNAHTEESGIYVSRSEDVFVSRQDVIILTAPAPSYLELVGIAEPTFPDVVAAEIDPVSDDYELLGIAGPVELDELVGVIDPLSTNYELLGIVESA